PLPLLLRASSLPGPASHRTPSAAPDSLRLHPPLHPLPRLRHRLVCHHGHRSSPLPHLSSGYPALQFEDPSSPAGKSDPPPVNCPRMKILPISLLFSRF